MTIAKSLTSALSKEVALVKGSEDYTWGLYNGPSMEVESRAGRSYVLRKGTKFGARLSSNGKEIRFIFPELGPSIVFTVDPDVAKVIYKRSTMVSDTELSAEQLYDEALNFQESVVRRMMKLLGSTLYDPNSVTLAMKINNKVAERISYRTRIQSEKDLSMVIQALEGLEGRLRLNLRPTSPGGPLMSHARGLLKVIARRPEWWIESDEIGVGGQLDGLLRWARLAGAFAKADVLAIEKYSQGDTVWRDEVPSETWDWIQENARPSSRWGG